MIKIEKTAKDKLINEIVDTELQMFISVNNLGGAPAPCQRDQDTFYIMRYSQHQAFSEAMLELYKNDLHDAKVAGRNLVAEKYAYMMEFSDNKYYKEKLADKLPQIPEEKMIIVEACAKEMVGFNKDFKAKYPYLSSKGRPEEAKDDGMISSYLYYIGELKTYSTITLMEMMMDITKAKKENKNLVYEIQKSTSSFYGYKSVDDAEAKMKAMNS